MKRNKEIFYIFVLQLLYIEAVFFYSLLDVVDSNKSLCKPTNTFPMLYEVTKIPTLPTT